MAQIILFDRKTIEERDYWLTKLSPAVERASRWSAPRRRTDSEEVAEVAFEVAGAVHEKLLQLTGGSPFLIYTSVLAALKICLVRRTGDPVVIVGSPCRRLGTEESQPVNVLPLLDVLDESKSFREVLLQIRATLLEAYSRQSYPFARLMRDLELPQGDNASPLFDVILGMDEVHADPPEMSNGVTVVLAQRDGRISGRVKVLPTLTAPQDVARLMDHVINILREALEDTGRPVHSLEMLSQAERRLLLQEWNDTRAAFATDKCVDQLFADWVARTPGAVAVSDPSSCLSYRDLDARANQLARRLISLGVRRASLVGVCLPSSVDLVTAILGVLKTGAAYVALDPALPAERLALMIDDAAVAALITADRRSDLVGRVRSPWVCLREDEAVLSEMETAELTATTTLRDLAYVIYTSGSTGTPKGVEIEHRGLLNLVAWHQARYRVGPEDRASQLAGPGFDASVWEIWPYLCSGASVHFPDQETALVPLRLLRWLAKEVISIAFFPTPLAEIVLDEVWPTGSTLRTLLTGGDRLHRAPRRARPFRLINHYGPTEGTVVTTCGEVEAVPVAESAPSIGWPVANVRVYLLDPQGRLVPPGAPGEIHVAGTGLARGYLGRPELTAERFIPDPFGGETGGRLYRTGDLARHRAGGEIEFLGRSDHQVKIRGFRIELGEIEAALAAHPAVLEVVVVVREDRGEKRLAAYLVLRSGESVDFSELRAGLRERLPEYMIPADFVLLPSLPLTPNGKVDRRALPEPTAEERPTPGQFTAPRTVVEEILTEIWAEVLGRERVGVLDNFFESGGHSLLATQVMSRVRDVFQLELPLRTLFDGPTVAELADEVDRARRGSEAPPLVAVPRRGDLPLSFAEERLWFLDSFDPGRPTYNIPVMLRVDGRLDVAALVGSLSEIVRRHETLRTRFDVNEAGPVRIVCPPGPVILPIVDLSAVPESVRQAEAREVAATEAVRPFNLSQGALICVTLLLLGDEHRLLLVTIHHIVSDGWSMDVLVREMSILYQAFVQGKPSPLPELPIQYADFALWQRRWLQGEILERQLAYWKWQLGRSSANLELPTDRPRPALLSYRGKSRTVSLPEDLAASMKALARSHQTTLFMALLAGFAALLVRITGGDEIRVGTPIAGRNRTETEGLIGFFVNTLVLRVELARVSSFAELLGRVREAVLDAHTHQDLPFERLVQELAPERRLSHSPLFQVMFMLQSALGEHDQTSGKRWTLLQNESTTSKFDLSLAMMEKGARLLASFEYSTDLFDETTILRWSVYFQNLLASVVADPGKPLSLLAVWTASERHQLIAEWNDTSVDVPRDVCVHELFEQQVARTPEALAVAFEDEILTYRELDSRAGQVAIHLRALGVQPEVTVALLVERSLDMIIGVLGILKAGGAYVPLDPDSPRERIALLIEDSGAPVLLTQSRFAGELPATQVSTVFLDALGPAPEWAAAGERRRAVPGNLAYVIYTSGSTGKPKGVGVEHRHLLSYLEGIQERLALPAGASFATVSTLAADLGNTVIFPPLCTGGTLHVISRERLSDAAALSEYLERFPVDCLKIVPSHLVSLLDAPQAGSILPRRLLVLGGEASPWALIDRVAALAPGCRIVNHYGPTETTIGILTLEIERSAAARPVSVPLGRPLDRTRLFILDRSLQPVPLGLPGELFVGGGGVSRGYLSRPDLTGERFVPDALSGLPGERLYRTGDRVRFLPDGRVEFLGRIDDQVKVRGFRVEPGEVEAVLREQEGVGEAVVLARVAPSGERALAAFVVPRAEAEVRSADLRAGLRARLPEHMVPATFTLVDALPLSPNGKLDRQALLKLEPAAEPLPAQELPRTWVEEVIAEIWCEVLGRERVGTEESFFDLGGHSLLATRVVSRLRKALGLEVPLRALFEAQTVAALARCVQGIRPGASEAPVPPMVPVPREMRLPLSFGQQRLWFLAQWEPGSSAYNVPHALHLRGDLRVQGLERALGEIIRRHEILRTTFPAVDGEPEQRIHPLGWKLPVIDLRNLPREDRRGCALRLAEEEAERPFDLERGPIVRASLLGLGGEEHVLLLTMHHIVSDGWSNALLIRELQLLYSAFTAGEPSPLSELPIQYADFAHWQRQWLADQVLESELAYWRGKLQGAPSVTELPLDRPRPAFQSSRGGSEALLLPAQLRTSLAAVARREGATLFMTLLAAFQTLLARCSAGEDVSIGTPVAGRHRIETEPLIGFFVNTLVLRSDLSRDPDFRKLLSQVRDTALEAHGHQDLPFEKLVEELEPERSLSHSPLFQVLFVLQNAPRRDLELTGLHLSGFGSGRNSAKFDLSLVVEDCESGLSSGLEYRTDLFDRMTVRRLLDHYAILLDGLASNPGMRLSELPLLSASELDQVLVQWNATAADGPRLCVHEMFAAQAVRTPEAVAVAWRGKELTYGELAAQSDAWAQALSRRGVGPEVPVGVCLERGPDLLAVLLGVLTAGGCYVPIDPAYPEERRLYMLADSGARLLLTQEALRSRFASFGGEILTLEADTLPEGRPVCLTPRAAAENLAYVIYTSGSTGLPKGVAIEHRSTSAFVAWAREVFPPEDLTGVLASTSVCFDLSIFELFVPLSWGGRIVLVENALELAHRPGEVDVRLLNTVPSVLRELLDAKAVPSSVRTINLAGEALSWVLVDRLEAETSAERVLNLYGPTEDTTYSTFCAVSTRSPGAPPIGLPIAGTQAYVVDDWGNAAPLGVSGELLLGGDGLARGYLGRPELTAERFVPDSFGREPGQRLYKTGDRVRRRPDGKLEFLGRIDHQVKVRGFRIELGEIEAVLRAHPAVREAVVVLRESASGDSRLVAYLVSLDARFGVADLREHLSGQLPDYMIPASFVALDRLPLTPNGKLDRRALPIPESYRPGRAGEVASPRDLLELRLAEVWEDLLDVRPIGIRDDFFELGGHSLLAVRLTSRIERLTGFRLPLVTLFQERTIERLALRLRRRTGESPAVLVPLQPAGGRSPLFLVHPVGGHLLGYLPLTRRLAAEQPLYGFQAEALAERGELRGGLEDLAKRYVAELLAARPQGPYLLGGWSLGGVVAFEMARQMEAQGRTVDGLVLLDSVLPSPDPEAPGPEQESWLLAAFAHDLGLTAGLREPWSDLPRSAPGQELAILLEQAHRAGALPPDLELTALQRLFEVFRLLSQAFHSYRPGPYGGPARLFVAAERVRECGNAPAGAWRSFVPDLTVEVLPGDHYSLLREPDVQTLAERLLASSGGRSH